MLTLKVLQNTVIKARPIQSAELGVKDKFSAKAGETFQVESYEKTRCNHYRVVLKAPREGQKVFYCYIGHFMLLEGGKPLGAILPEAVEPLLIPYLSQRDNYENPDGSCNVTSFAMIFKHFGIPQKTGAGQFEDELYRYCEQNGLSRHSPYDLATMAESYGVRSTFTDKGSLRDIKKRLSEGKPCISHGYYTSYGHIIVLCGYNKTGFLVNDPWGYLDQYDSYQNERSGKGYIMAYDQFSRLTAPDSYFWFHWLEKI